MGLNMRLMMITLFVMFMNTTVFAGWSGPAEVFSGNWGNSAGQFAIEYGDSGDIFPKRFCLSSGGFIAVADEINSRVQVFSNNGKLMASFGPKNIPEAEGWQLGWPLRLGCMSNSIYTEFDKYTQLYNIDGTLIKSWNSLQGGLSSILDNDNFMTKASTNYYQYSHTGQLIKIYTSRPPELGVLERKYISKRKYLYTITYPDKVWSMIGIMQYPHQRDANGNIYAVGNREIVRFSDCGKEMARLRMPETTLLPLDIEIPDDYPEGQELPRQEIKEEYGSPVLAPNGDVYTWKRTPEKYSIVKWTWVDEPGGDYGPDAPTGLTVTPSTTGLYMAWKPSPQDPGCVTGYELSRSTSAGGVYSVLTTVDKGVGNYNDTTALEGTTYFYKIRAKSGNDFSPYTEEASAKR